MNNKSQASLFKVTAIITAMVLLVGCVGRTGKVGTPIADRYQTQLESLKLGVSTPDDLKKIFTKRNPVSLKEAKMDGDKKIEIWEVAKSGSMDAAALLIWGYVSYDKDQELLFRFENDKLVSWESIVIPDPAQAPVTQVSSPRNSN